MSAFEADGGRRQLQLTIGTLAVIPFASGLAGMLVGSRILPGGDGQVTATLESEYRFTNAFWFASAPLIWWLVPRVERETTVVRALLGTIFVGGVARLLSWRRNGRPHPIFVAAIGLELVVVPALGIWQAAVAAAAEPLTPSA